MARGYEVTGTTDAAILSEDGLADLIPEENHKVAWTPEKRLMGAVLGDAILESIRGKALGRRVAQNWIRSCRRDYLFSFEHVCETLGMDPTERRRRIAEMWRTPEKHRKTRHRVNYRHVSIGGTGKRAKAEF